MWPLLAVGAAAAYGAYAAAWPSASRWGKSIHRLAAHGRQTALTFDDGPSNETPRFLDALNQFGVLATFFVCGKNVARRPQTARAIVEAGHEIGNHTYSHPKLIACGPRRVREEIVRTQRQIEDATGVSPRLFRPPYGVRSPALASVQAELDLLGVHWTVSGKDWKWDASKIAARVLGAAAPGNIICLHDGCDTRAIADRSETLAAVRIIVPRLQAAGYDFVPLPTDRIR